MPQNILGRIAVLIAGLWIMAAGVSFSVLAGLGTSPISSLPYTLSLISPLTVGTATILLNAFLVLLQFIILRRRFKPVQLLQVAVSAAFGLMIDATGALLSSIEVTAYAARWLFCAAGIILVGAGVSLEVLSGTVPLAAEGLSLALSSATGKRFSSMKIAVDLSLVISSLIISFSSIGSWGGVREGTVAAALFVGVVARAFGCLLSPLRCRFFSLQ